MKDIEKTKEELIEELQILRKKNRALEKLDGDSERSLVLFKKAVSSSTDAIGFSKPDGKHWYQNKAFDNLFGEIGDDPPKTLYVDEKVGRGIFETIESGREWVGEVEMYGKNREILDILLRAYSIKDEEGNIVGLVGVHTDITERKQMELYEKYLDRINQAILKETDLKKMLGNALNVMLDIFRCDRVWLLYPCDPEAEFYEIPIMRTKPDWLAPEGLRLPIDSEASVVIQEALETDEPVYFYKSREPRLPKNINKDFWVQSQMIRGLYPKIGGNWILGMHQCTYERNWTEKEKYLFERISQRITDGLNNLLFFRDMRESEENLRTTLNSIGDAVIATDRVGKVVRMNSVAENLTGWKLEEALGKSLEEVFRIINSITLEKCENPVEKVMETGKIVGLANHTMLIAKDGSARQIADSGAPIRDSEGKITGVVLVFRDVTKEYEMIEDIEHTNILLRSVIEQSPVPMALVTYPDYIVKFFNRACLDFLGVPKRADFEGKRLDELDWNWQNYTPEGKLIPPKETPIAHALRGEATHKKEIKTIDRHGNIRYNFTEGVPIYDSEGNLIAGFIIFPDITERKKAEQELKNKQEQLEVITDHLPLLVAYVNSEEKYLYVNKPYANWYGFPKEEFIGKQIKSFLNDITYKGVTKSLKKVFRGEKVSFENVGYDLEGNLKAVRATYVPHFGKDEDVKAFVGVVEDITERKEAEEKIKHLNAVLSAIRNINQLIVRETEPAKIIQYTCDNFVQARGFLGAWIAMLDREGKVTHIVKSGLDDNFSDLVAILKSGDYPDCAKAIFQELAPVFVGTSNLNCAKCHFSGYFGKSPRVSVRIGHGENIYGMLTVYLPEHVVVDEKEIELLDEIARDIGFALYKFNLEEEKKDIQNQLFHSQKMQAIGQLAGGVAHDFNNMLQAINLYSDILLMSLDKDNPLRKNAEEIKEAAERSASLTQRLLAFSRKQVLAKRVINMKQVIPNIQKMLRRLIGEDVDLITEFEEDLYPIKADEGQIEQVIINLAVNARDAMPDGGKLRISAKNIQIDEFSRKINPDARLGEFICLTVSDTGLGMDESIKNQIFNPFFTTKKAFGGTGLGLSTVYGIVQQHDGWLDVYSEPDLGTTFHVYLPVTDEKHAAKEVNTAMEFEGHGERILFIEDEESIRTVTVKMLERKGFALFSAENGAQATQLFEQEKGNFDLILSDVVLPDESGLTLAQKFLEKRPNLPVILSSGYTDQRSHSASIQEMGIRFLQKPYSLSTLLGAIREAIRLE